MAATRIKAGGPLVAGLLILAVLLGVIGAGGQEGEGGAITVISAKTGDADQDGIVDHITVRFSAPVDLAAVDPSGFSVSDPRRTVTDVIRLPEMNDDELRVVVAEGLLPDTDITPRLTVRAGAVMSTADVPLPVAEYSAVVEDGAPPVLIVAYAKDPSKIPPGQQNRDFVVWFSEGVHADGEGLTDVHFDYVPGDPPPGAQDWVVNGIDGVVEGKPHTPGQKHVWLRAERDFHENDLDMGDRLPGDRIVVRAAVTDMAGNRAIHHQQEQDDRDGSAVAIPYAVTADGNIGTDWVTLRFNGPVEAVSTAHVGVVPASEGHVTGITNVVALQGAVAARLTLDKPILPTEVDHTPAQIRVLPNSILASQIGVHQREILVPLWDVTPPRLTSATTRDLADNGIVDAFELVWSERIDDVLRASFIAIHVPVLEWMYDPDPDGEEPYKCPLTTGPVALDAACPLFPLPRETKRLHMYCDADSAPDAANPEPGRLFGTCSLDTGDVIQDNTVYLRFSITHIQVPGGQAVPVSDLLRGELLHTGRIPGFILDQCAFLDLALSPLPHPVPTDLGGPGNCSDAARGGIRPQVRDGAPPRIVLAITRDLSGDGYLDGYLLRFSEPVQGASFDPAHWFIEGHHQGVRVVPDPDLTIVNMTSSPLAPEIPHLRVDKVPEEFLLVAFDSKVWPDDPGNTGDKPQILYLPPPGQGLRDLTNNPMKAFREGGVVPLDGAQPRLIAVYGEVGSPELTLEFSEGVGRGAGGQAGLRTQEVEYANANVEGSSASGHERVVHTVGSRFATMVLNAPLSAADFGNDTVVPSEQFRIYEHGGVLYVPSTPVPIRDPVDRFPPGRVTGLEVVTANTTANSVTLRWTAPGNSGMSGGPVDGYLFKWSASPITTLTGFDLANTVRDDSVDFQPTDLAGPGDTQEATIVGLDPDTVYYLSVKATDASGNNAEELSDPTYVVVQTGVDDTPPVGTCSFLPSVVAFTAQGRLVTFSWEPYTDPQSTVLYRYELLGVQRGLRAEDPITTQPQAAVFVPWAGGPQQFTMRAESAGGVRQACVQALPPHPDDPTYYAAHDGVVVDPTLDRRVLQVRWELPPAESLPGNVSGLSIWRIEPGDGGLTLVTAIRGEYDVLRRGHHIDLVPGASRDSQYAIAMEFTERPGFPSRDAPPDTEMLPTSAVKSVPMVPWWVWLLVGLFAVLLLAGGAAFLMMREKDMDWDVREELDEEELAALQVQAEAEQGWQEMPEEEGAEAGAKPSPGGARTATGGAAAAAAGSAASSGESVHNVKCPRCQQDFTAQGTRPLKIECPHCGVTGTL